MHVTAISFPDVSTIETVLDFGRGEMIATANIAFPGMTDTKIIQPFYSSNLDEVAILNMRVCERGRVAGIGFELIGVAPEGAFGEYNVRCVIS